MSPTLHVVEVYHDYPISYDRAHILPKCTSVSVICLWPIVMDVAVAESMHVQQLCKYKGQLDPTMTVVTNQHTTHVPCAFPLSLVVTRDTVLTVCARRDTESSYLWLRAFKHRPCELCLL